MDNIVENKSFSEMLKEMNIDQLEDTRLELINKIETISDQLKDTEYIVGKPDTWERKALYARKCTVKELREVNANIRKHNRKEDSLRDIVPFETDYQELS